MKTRHQASNHRDHSVSATQLPARQAPRKNGATQHAISAKKKVQPKSPVLERSFFAELDKLPPRPAFRAFTLEDEDQRRSRMRSRGASIRYTDLAPNSAMEVDVLYLEAIGHSSDVIWEISRNRSGKIVHKEKHLPAAPEEAAKELMMVARNAVAYLSMLQEMNPELCRRIAATESRWPVIADLGEPQWRLPIVETISTLDLGSSIKGFIRSAQTSHKNVIRRWATAIHDTLLRTRFEFKEAEAMTNRHKTTEGCPEWARKTLKLPIFTKASARAWARLGEEMLLEQMPSFLDHQEIAHKKRNWTHRAGNRLDRFSKRMSYSCCTF